MRVLGNHVILDLYGIDYKILDNMKMLQSILENAAIACNATIIKTVFHHFSPQGVSGTIVIAESHISIHTWPEYGYAAVDIFTCGERVNLNNAINYVLKQLQPQNYTISRFDRGCFLK